MKIYGYDLSPKLARVILEYADRFSAVRGARELFEGMPVHRGIRDHLIELVRALSQYEQACAETDEAMPLNITNTARLIISVPIKTR